MATATDSLIERVRPAPETVQWGALVVGWEILILLAYVIFTDPQFTSLLAWRTVVYPFVWVNVALWAVWRTSPAPTTRRRRLLAGGLGVGYFLVLAYAGGLVGSASGIAYGPYLNNGFPPGWSPALLYSGELLRLTVFPFKLVGYLTLSYLVYATVIDAAGSAISGVLGLLSCVSCTWPVVASLATGLFGGTSAVALATTDFSYGISTAVFVVTVGLLVWRPTIR